MVTGGPPLGDTQCTCGAPEDRARDTEPKGLVWVRQSGPAAARNPRRSAPPAAARGSPAPPRALRGQQAPRPARPSPPPPHSPLTGTTAPGAGAGAGAAAGAGVGALGSPGAWAPSAAGAARAAGGGHPTGPRTPRPAPVRQPGTACHWPRAPGPALPHPGWPRGPPVRGLGRAGLPGAARRAVPARLGLMGPGLRGWLRWGRGPGETTSPETARTLPGTVGTRSEIETPRRSGSAAGCGLGRGRRCPTRAPAPLLEPSAGPLGTFTARTAVPTPP